MDVNDHYPQFIAAPYSVEVSEVSTSDLVFVTVLTSRGTEKTMYLLLILSMLLKQLKSLLYILITINSSQ